VIDALAGLVARARSLWRGVRRGRALNAEMDEEFRAHILLRTDDLVTQGMAPVEAERRARMEFGIPERYKEAGRAARGLRLLDGLGVSALDLRLGWRMLAKYPGITLVGGFAMAFAIWVGAGFFEIGAQLVRPVLPVPGGDRIVALRNRDVASSRVESKALHDLAAWREQLATVTDLGAYRTLPRNLIVTGTDAEPVEVAEISASAFRVTGMPAMHGRTLVAADERPGALPVLVLGYDVWRTRFGADPAAVGRTVRLGSTAHTVVGVMPEGYAFPVSHDLWVPLRLDALDHARRQGPGITIFGRLADGASLDEARAELATVGQRAQVAWRDTHAHLRPEVMPWAQSVIDVSGRASIAVLSINVPLVMLLVLVCGNVALLMFARAATRESEIVVRSALGASRRRIVAQLFAEALVLGTVAAVVGLVAAGFGLEWVWRTVEGLMTQRQKFPFWLQPRLSAPTIVYAALLTILGAVISGVMPALKVTHGLGARLKAATAGGGGLRFGGVWTAIIVVQVALTVAFPVGAFMARRDRSILETTTVGFADRDYLTFRLEMDREARPGPLVPRPTITPDDSGQAAFRARYQVALDDLLRRLRADPAVVDVTYGDRLPRMYHPHRLIEVDEGGAAPLHPSWPAYRVSDATVHPDYFQTIGVPVTLGRGFRAGDMEPGARSVLVNESFVKRVLGGRNPIGRRVRYLLYEDREPRKLEAPSEWYHIVGVVPDLGMAVGADDMMPAEERPGGVPRGDPKVAGVYHPAVPGVPYPAQLGVRVRGDPMAFVPRLRAVATTADPTLRLYDFVPLDQVNEGELQFLAFWYRILLMVSVVALTLSLAGIYAVMSFTVARRTREIGVRIALGASRWRLLASVFRRPLAQVGAGIALGTSLVFLLSYGIYFGMPPLRALASIAGYGAVMLLVCLMACVVPTRRALAVEPTEALRAE
jgi:putative ABC transport system permease protein